MNKMIACIRNTDDASCQDWPMDEHYNTRRRFCLTYEGYHKLCHCQQPYVTKETHTQVSEFFKWWSNKLFHVRFS